MSQRREANSSKNDEIREGGTDERGMAVATALENLLSLDRGCTFVRKADQEGEVEMRVTIAAHTAGMNALERFWS